MLTLLLTIAFGLSAKYDKGSGMDEYEKQGQAGKPQASAHTVLRYALTGAQLVNLAFLIAVFVVIMMPFSKAKAKVRKHSKRLYLHPSTYLD